MANKTSQCHPSLWLYETNAFCPAWAKPTQAAQTSDPASKQKALLASLFHPVSVQGTGAVGTRMTPRSSLAGRRATLRRKERCTAAVLSSRRVSQVGRAGQEPSRRERDGGGWRRRLGWLPGREDRELAQALAQKLEAEGMVCSPRSCLEPSQLPSLNLPRGGRQESNTLAQHPHGIPPLFPADPTPSRGFPCTETPPPPITERGGSVPARRRVRSIPRHPPPPPREGSSRAKMSPPPSRLPRNGVAAYYSKCYCSGERGCVQEQAISCLKCSGTSAMCTFFHGIIRVAGAGDKRAVCSGRGCWVVFFSSLCRRFTSDGEHTSLLNTKCSRGNH